MIQIRRFLVFLACILFATAAWLAAENFCFRTWGEIHSAIVTKTWQESTMDFKSLKSKILHRGNTNHVEIALADELSPPTEADEWDAQNQASGEFKNGDIKKQLHERFQKNREELNKKLQGIHDSLKAPIVPENTPRYSIHNISDKDLNRLYTGKRVDVFILKQNAMLDTQVEHLLSTREYILILLGSALLLLSFGLTFIKQSTLPKINAD